MNELLRSSNVYHKIDSVVLMGQTLGGMWHFHFSEKWNDRFVCDVEKIGID